MEHHRLGFTTSLGALGNMPVEGILGSLEIGALCQQSERVTVHYERVVRADIPGSYRGAVFHLSIGLGLAFHEDLKAATWGFAENALSFSLTAMED
jgi:hypothetical protein